jgi:hypothetical protein
VVAFAACLAVPCRCISKSGSALGEGRLSTFRPQGELVWSAFVPSLGAAELGPLTVIGQVSFDYCHCAGGSGVFRRLPPCGGFRCLSTSTTVWGVQVSFDVYHRVGGSGVFRLLLLCGGVVRAVRSHVMSSTHAAAVNGAAQVVWYTPQPRLT